MLSVMGEILVTFGPVALAAMGVIVSLIPNIARREEKYPWVVAFCLLGGLVSVASWYELRLSNHIQQAILLGVTGGSNVCYVEASDGFNAAGQRIISSAEIINKGKTICFDVALDILATTRDHPMNNLHVFTPLVYPGRQPLQFNFELGAEYTIDISAKNGHFIEGIKIPSSNPTDKLRWRLMDDSGQVLAEENWVD